MKNIVLRIFIVFVIIIILLITYFLLSARPTSYIIKDSFEGGGAVKPDNYQEILSNVIIEKDITYQSQYKQNQMDFIYPKDSGKDIPIIIWIHGGGYVGGDKSDITEYLVQLANEGYFCVNVNYQLAPNAVYPAQLKQISEVYSSILSNKNVYPMDKNRIFFAGDSAGAQMVSQYVNAQVNEDYSILSGIKQVVKKDNISGAILLCGPYDFSSLNIGKTSKYKFVLDFFVGKMGQAYFGNINWKNSKEISIASITDKVDESFPPTFISDSNTLSFEEQGMALADMLESYNVPVTRSFFPIEDGEITHEYQFKMDLPQSIITFEKLVNYLDEISK